MWTPVSAEWASTERHCVVGQVDAGYMAAYEAIYHPEYLSLLNNGAVRARKPNPCPITPLVVLAEIIPVE